MGNAQVTVQNLEVIKIDSAHNAILVKGSIPGPNKSFVIIKDTAKNNKVKTLPARELVNYAKTDTTKNNDSKNEA